MKNDKCNACSGFPTAGAPCEPNNFTKAVVEINNPEECPILFHKVVIPVSMGDETAVPPAIGKYSNVLLVYEANNHSYLYSSDGVPTRLNNGFTDYEDAINLPQINGVTLLGNKNSSELGLADAPVIIQLQDNSWSCDKTPEQIYDAFNNGATVVLDSGPGGTEGTRVWPVQQLGYNANDNKLLGIITYAHTQNADEFTGDGGYGLFTLYGDHTADFGDLPWQRPIFVSDFTGLGWDGETLYGVPATSGSIGMVKPGLGLSVESDGTLSASGTVIGFDTVAAMKLDTQLANGDYVRTYGYRSKGDRGGAFYVVRELTNADTVDEMTLIALADNSLVAELNSPIVLPETLGAYGDGTHDDSAVINKLIELYKSGQKIGFSPVIYGVGSPILVTITSTDGKACRLDFNDCTLKGLNNTMECVLRVNAHEGLYAANQNGFFRNLTLDQDYKTLVGLDILYSGRIVYDNISVKNVPVGGGIGIWVSGRLAEGNASPGNLFNNIRGSGDWNDSYSDIYDYNTFIKIDSGDNTFSNLDFQNIKRGIEVNRFCTFSNVHGYVGMNNRYVDSYFMKFNAGALVTNAYPDTQQFAFVNNTHDAVTLTNVILIFSNESGVDAETLTAHPPYSFISLRNNEANMAITGLQIQNNLATLYLQDSAVINGTQYYRTNPIIDQVSTSYTSISYQVTPFIMTTMTDGTTHFTPGGISYQGDMQNMKIRLICKTAVSNPPIKPCRWNTGVWRNYALIEGKFPAVITRPGSSTRDIVAVDVTNQELTIFDSMAVGDYLEVTIPMIQKQVGN